MTESIQITRDHIDHPHAFCKDDLPEESKIRFATDSAGRVICPISLEELEEGSSCYKVDCCKMVFLQENFKKWAASSPNCPNCRTGLREKSFRLAVLLNCPILPLNGRAITRATACSPTKI